MKQLTSKELHQLTEAWLSWTRSAPNDSQLRSRERLLLVFLLIRHGALRLGEALEINDLKDFDYPTCTIRIGGSRGREVQIPEKAMEAMRMSGVTPLVRPIRGGTDGAQLSYRGLPCPNLFTGGMNFHGKFEYCSVDTMQKAVQTIINLVRLWAAPSAC